MSYVRALTICLLLVYFVSAAGCHCFDLKVSEHEMLSFPVRKEIIKNDNSLVVILLFKVVKNEFLQTL